VVAVGPEEVFEIIVGSGEIGDFITGEEMRLITSGDLEEVS
jgi:hypothetical protein